MRHFGVSQRNHRNPATLCDELRADGLTFCSATDTEVLALLIVHHFNIANGSLNIVVCTMPRTCASGVIDCSRLSTMVDIRCDAPLIGGLGEDEQFRDRGSTVSRGRQLRLAPHPQGYAIR